MRYVQNMKNLLEKDEDLCQLQKLKRKKILIPQCWILKSWYTFKNKNL